MMPKIYRPAAVSPRTFLTGSSGSRPGIPKEFCRRRNRRRAAAVPSAPNRPTRPIPPSPPTRPPPRPPNAHRPPRQKLAAA